MLEDYLCLRQAKQEVLPQKELTELRFYTYLGATSFLYFNRYNTGKTLIIQEKELFYTVSGKTYNKISKFHCYILRTSPFLNLRLATICNEFENSE